MKELEDLAEKVKGQLNLDYDAKSIKFIEGFIERQRNGFDIKQQKGLVNSIGSFVGQCVIKNYGGRWQVDQDTQAVCIALDDKTKYFRLQKLLNNLRMVLRILFIHFIQSFQLHLKSNH